jgi:hypothetical protein
MGEKKLSGTVLACCSSRSIVLKRVLLTVDGKASSSF